MKNTNKLKHKYKIIVLLTFIIMVGTNALANIIPINGVNTGEVSDNYPNLFGPAAITFSIWGLIYLLLAGYTAYQLFKPGTGNLSIKKINKIGLLFSISSIANTLWVLSWHYDFIGISMLLMIAILISLILINQTLVNENLTKIEKLLVKLPFQIYFGWITVATIANATVLLVSLKWDGFGISDVTWTIIILLVGTLIGNLTLRYNNAIAYGAVFLWAYTGILIKHISTSGFSGQYLSVIITVIISLLVFASNMFITSKQ